MPPPAVPWAWSDKPPKNAGAHKNTRPAKREQHCARRRRESPSGKDPTVVVRYIILLHLILRWKVVGFERRLIPVSSLPQSLALATGNVKFRRVGTRKKY